MTVGACPVRVGDREHFVVFKLPDSSAGLAGSNKGPMIRRTVLKAVVVDRIVKEIIIHCYFFLFSKSYIYCFMLSIIAIFFDLFYQFLCFSACFIKSSINLALKSDL